jgi:beta-glucosidase-like glycosyl hydrolase
LSIQVYHYFFLIYYNTSTFFCVGLKQTNVNTYEHQQLALRAAHEAIVLLQNNPVSLAAVGPDGAPRITGVVGETAAPILPLSGPLLQRVAVIGPNADVIRLGDYAGTGLSQNFVSYLEGITQAVTEAGGELKQIPDAAALGRYAHCILQVR